MSLHLAPGLNLPNEAITQTFAVLAKRGAGKTYLTLVMVEQMIKANLPVVIADPIGVTWGLRASADGKHEGLPIVVLGGDHGDLPLEVTAGSLIAEAIVEKGFSAVLDLSRFRKGEQVRFMTDFAETLYHKNRAPLHLVLDEADAFAPQKPQKGQERMLGAVEDLVRRGRARGIGITLTTKRAAVLNKDVLTQVEVMICLRTIAPQDRDAIDAWIKVHGTPEQRDELMSSLPSLPIGDAWFWSPGWLDLFKRVKIHKRETFDSSATPVVGKKLVEPKRLAEVDLKHLQEQMAATVAKVKAEDPKELRREIAELKKELVKKVPVQQHKMVVEKVEIPVLKDHQIDKLDIVVARLDKIAQSIIGLVREDFLPAIKKAGTKAPTGNVPMVIAKWENKDAPVKHNVQLTPMGGKGGSPSEGLSGPEQRILDALAWLETLGITPAQMTAVAFLAGYSVGGGAFNNPKSSLRVKGLIAYNGNMFLSLTDAGREKANAPAAPLTAEALQDMVLARLPGPERKLLSVILEAYPESLSNEELAEKTGYAPSGGAFHNPKGRLRTLGLIDYPAGGRVRALPLLFLM